MELYDKYVEYNQSRGWTREQIAVNQEMTTMVTTQAVAANVTDWVIDLKAPAGQKISIKGIEQVSQGADARSAHSFRMRCADSDDNELAFLTAVRFSKESATGRTQPLDRVLYADVNMTKQAGAVTSSNTTFKNDPEWYRFSQGIELNGEEHLRVYISNTLGTIAAASIPAAITKASVRFSLVCNVWTRSD